MTARKVRFGGSWVDLSPAAASVFRPDDPVQYPINATYGDEMSAVPLSGTWTKRNIAQAETLAAAGTMKSTGVTVTLDAQGDALTRPSPSGVDFELVVALEINDYSSMTGPCILNSSGSGGSYGPYNDGRIYSWNISTYAYGSTGTNNGGAPGPGLFWVRMKYATSGGNALCSHSCNGVDWTGTVSVGCGVASQIGIVRPFTNSTSIVTIRRFNVFLGPSFYVP